MRVSFLSSCRRSRVLIVDDLKRENQTCHVFFNLRFYPTRYKWTIFKCFIDVKAKSVYVISISDYFTFVLSTRFYEDFFGFKCVS